MARTRIIALFSKSRIDMAEGGEGSNVGRRSTVGNDMDVQLWRQFDQPISQSCFPKQGVMDSASAQHDLCNTCQAGKLRDLIRYIITVDRFDRSTQLLGQMQIAWSRALSSCAIH